MNRILESNVKIPNPFTDKTSALSAPSNKGVASSKVASSSGDQIETDAQSQLQTLASAVNDPVRASRVEALRSQVQSGNYVVDPTALSGSIVDSLLRGY
jgi:anti-sigma28 factor (negative regulator of flagellin synthesis)